MARLLLMLIGIGGVGACSVGQYMSHSNYACQTCPTGQWQPSDPYRGQTCRDTPPGYIPTADQSNFEPCPALTFNPFKNSLKCIKCITNSVPGSKKCPVFAEALNPVSRVTRELDGATLEATLTCGVGTSIDEAGTGCAECPDGWYQTHEDWAHDSCFPALSGHYALPDHSDVGDCGVGTYSESDEQSECKSCTDGSYAESYVNQECWQAQAGYYATADHTMQVACSEGHYADGEGNTECTQCALGSHSEMSAAPKCRLCNEGTHMNKLGSALGECEACLPGRFADSAGATACKACQAGKMIQHLGSLSCNDAPEGYIPNDDRTGLIGCGKGTFAKGDGNSECTNCLPGSSSNISHAGYCQKCSPGRAMAQNGSTISYCSACNDGTHATGAGNTECKLCAPGSYTEGDGSENSYDTCELCHAGEFQAEPGTNGCGDCSAGSYSSKGASSCTICKMGEYSAQNGASQCAACSSGTYTSGSGKTSCKVCFTLTAALGFSYADQCIPVWGWVLLFFLLFLFFIPSAYKFRKWRKLQIHPEAVVAPNAAPVCKIIIETRSSGSNGRQEIRVDCGEVKGLITVEREELDIVTLKEEMNRPTEQPESSGRSCGNEDATQREPAVVELLSPPSNSPSSSPTASCCSNNKAP